MTRKLSLRASREHYHNQSITCPVSRVAQSRAMPELFMMARALTSRSTSAVGNAPVLTSGQ